MNQNGINVSNIELITHMTVTGVLPYWTSIMVINATESISVMPNSNARIMMLDQETALILLIHIQERRSRLSIFLIVSLLSQKCRDCQMPRMYWPTVC